MTSIRTSTLLSLFLLLSIIYSVAPQNQPQRPQVTQPRSDSDPHNDDNDDHTEGSGENEHQKGGRREQPGGDPDHHGEHIDWEMEEQHIYNQCKNNKLDGKCFGSPKNCIDSKKCNYMVLVEKDLDVKKTYIFTLYSSAILNTSNPYVAVGLSRDSKMKDTSIVACIRSAVHEGANKTILAYWSAKAEPPKKVVSSYIKPIENHSYNQKILCRFRRDTTSTVENKQFKLDEKKFKILLAVGEYYEDENRAIMLKSHKQVSDRIISDEMYLTNKPSDKPDKSDKNPKGSSSHYVSHSILATICSLVISIVHL